MKKAFSTIDLLVGLLISAIIFCALIKIFYPVQLLKNFDEQSLQEQIDEKVNEVELLKQKSIEAQNDLSSTF